MNNLVLIFMKNDSIKPIFLKKGDLISSDCIKHFSFDAQKISFDLVQFMMLLLFFVSFFIACFGNLFCYF